MADHPQHGNRWDSLRANAIGSMWGRTVARLPENPTTPRVVHRESSVVFRAGTAESLDGSSSASGSVGSVMESSPVAG